MRAEHKADLITGLVLMALGAAAIVGGLTMDRLEIRGIHPASIPGLVPIALGAALLVAAATLAVRAARRLKAATGDREGGADDGGSSARAMGIAVLLCFGYAVGLIGQVPYAVATGIFVFLFITVFEWQADLAPRTRLIRLATALLQAVLVAVIVSTVFETVFLVRLP